ncbi:hypothetical protein Tco_1581703 [Tanacetum coccineum]
MEQYIALIPDDIKPGIVNPKIGDDIEFNINANFMRELRCKLFVGTDDEDAYEHVRTVLAIVDLFHFPGVTHDVWINKKITRKQSKTGKHGHENQKSTKAGSKARKVKPQSNPVNLWCPQLDQTATNEAQMIKEMIGQD